VRARREEAARVQLAREVEKGPRVAGEELHEGVQGGECRDGTVGRAAAAGDIRCTSALTEMSKTSSGRRSAYFCKLLYSPVPGVLKSGMPADTEMPAPASTTRLLTRPLRSRFAKPAMETLPSSVRRLSSAGSSAGDGSDTDEPMFTSWWFRCFPCVVLQRFNDACFTGVYCCKISMLLAQEKCVTHAGLIKIPRQEAARNDLHSPPTVVDGPSVKAHAVIAAVQAAKAAADAVGW